MSAASRREAVAPPESAEPAWRHWTAAHATELWLFAITFAGYALSSWGMLWHQSPNAHFVHQADAFLHGQLAIRGNPPNLNDWVRIGDAWYVSFPPFPAVLMMPFVALFGTALDDTLFTVFFGALNVPLLYSLLRRIGARGDEGADGGRPKSEHVHLALAYGFGTLAWTCAIRGEVWFTAETIGVTLTLLYLRCALGARRPALAGLLLACAAITRTPLGFSIVFFVCEAAFPDVEVSWAAAKAVLRDRARRARTLGLGLRFAWPMLLVGAPMAWMNHARFGSFGEFGHSHLYQNRVNEAVRQYGLFNYVYLERNLHAAFTRLPVIQFDPLRIGFDGNGMSLLVTTPLLLLLLWPRERPRLHRRLWLTVAIVAVPGFFYMNSGWFQFGFRFSLDYTPYLIVLLAQGRRPLTLAWRGLAAAGLVVNAWGAAVFSRWG